MLGVNIGSTFAGDADVKTMASVGFDGNTLYVGGSGANNYTTIQSAIDDAVDGDTVFVYDDSSPYYEDVVVDKSINLIGEDKNSTIIDADGSGHVIKIVVDGVNILGFTATGSTNGLVVEGSSYINIADNNILNNFNQGIKLDSSSNITISGNILSDNNHKGIYLHDSSNNILSENNIVNSEYAGIEFSDSWYNNVTNNSITSITRGEGIQLWNSSYITISGNTISNHTECGIELLDSSNFNLISGNIITSTISKNVEGIVLETGSDHNNITGNVIKRHVLGIYVYGSDYNNISNNEIANNSNKELSFYTGGIRLLQASNNIIYHNNFINNRPHARFMSCTNLWDGNYWDNKLLRGSPKLILGVGLLGFPWINFDWHPAQEPYDI